MIINDSMRFISNGIVKRHKRRTQPSGDIPLHSYAQDIEIANVLYPSLKDVKLFDIEFNKNPGAQALNNAKVHYYTFDIDSQKVRDRVLKSASITGSGNTATINLPSVPTDTLWYIAVESDRNQFNYFYSSLRKEDFQKRASKLWGVHPDSLLVTTPDQLEFGDSSFFQRVNYGPSLTANRLLADYALEGVDVRYGITIKFRGKLAGIHNFTADFNYTMLSATGVKSGFFEPPHIEGSLMAFNMGYSMQPFKESDFSPYISTGGGIGFFDPIRPHDFEDFVWPQEPEDAIVVHEFESVVTPQVYFEMSLPIYTPEQSYFDGGFRVVYNFVDKLDGFESGSSNDYYSSLFISFMF